jgi:hypothetical protein
VWTMTGKGPVLLDDQWPQIRKAKAAGKTAWGYFGSLVKILHKRLGEAATAQLLEQLMVENARKYFLAGLKSFGIEGKDPYSLASYFKLTTGEIIGYDVEIEKLSPNEVIYRLHPPCIWFPDLDIPSSFCRALGAFEREAVKLVSSELEVRMVKLMTEGDSCCELVFKRKGTTT